MASDAVPLHFDLPEQPLARSLAVFGYLTGHSVLVTSGLTDGREASPVQGDFAPRDALQRMLAGTGLVARYTGASAFTLVPVQATAVAQDERAPAGAPVAGSPRALQAYAAVLQGAVTRVLCIAQPDAFGRYRLAIQLWIDPAGAVTEARLLEGSGVPARDATVLASLRSLGLDTPPPAALPQPLTLLLTPRPDPARDCRPYLRARAAGATG
ncbi:secretin and TonB N-terminal domain-containing protein [Variovorax sp. EBFNA2]|uniref:STN domain-containing protein n=1 Tax=Variovorax sp. EBFNA2 TaxID=3342097 RepID=UPI0029C0E4B2|nr:secretin and TonB N-terminal domain-containing protein [Variovorax boronicumulans]WPG41438.1 secretin and TonB N terminus short domain protein [Variovorax boronicumulans]